ncbi:MAG: BrnA antitoxin family protein [Lachnospiraceae bacterium]|nr:BrnA antitoxin family protein [Lachnospiraceae bacterium]
MKEDNMKTAKIPPIEEQIAALKQKSDSEIDFSDIPEIVDWSKAVRGKFYRPVKKHVTIRLDADILDWFKKNSAQYQTAINKALREYIENVISNTA